MARPTKWRKIAYTPVSPYFLPASENTKDGETTVLLFEEVEAIRLKDLLGLEQAECAKEMEVSRPTFQRILLSAREKIADAIVNGKGLHMQGGNYTRKICKIACKECGHMWSESVENVENVVSKPCHSYHCPSCGSTMVGCAKRCSEHLCGGGCCKRRK